MSVSRRSFLRGAALVVPAIVLAPAIVRAANLMPVKALLPLDWHHFAMTGGSIPEEWNLGTGDFTIECWVKFNDRGQAEAVKGGDCSRIVSSRNGNLPGEFYLDGRAIQRTKPAQIFGYSQASFNGAVDELRVSRVELLR